MPPCPAQGVPFGKQSTYELFRHYYALPSARDQNGCEVAAVRGVLASVLGMIKGGATHIAVATDHVNRPLTHLVLQSWRRAVLEQPLDHYWTTLFCCVV